MAIAVIGRFRFPRERLGEARLEMRKVIEATRTEPGCLAYSYAEDVLEPGLFHVTEMWESRGHLDAHFKAAHMVAWTKVRGPLGFSHREVAVFELGAAEEI